LGGNISSLVYLYLDHRRGKGFWLSVSSLYAVKSKSEDVFNARHKRWQSWFLLRQFPTLELRTHGWRELCRWKHRTW
jgi:hypothetical protein